MKAPCARTNAVIWRTQEAVIVLICSKPDPITVEHLPGAADLKRDLSLGASKPKPDRARWRRHRAAPCTVGAITLSVVLRAQCAACCKCTCCSIAACMLMLLEGRICIFSAPRPSKHVISVTATTLHRYQRFVKGLRRDPADSFDFRRRERGRERRIKPKF